MIKSAVVLESDFLVQTNSKNLAHELPDLH